MKKEIPMSIDPTGAIAAALSSLASLAIEKLQDELATGRKAANYGYHATGASRQRSPHRVAHDKRVVRKARNRKANRRFQHG